MKELKQGNNNIKSKDNIYLIIGFILSILIWIFNFKGFLFKELAFTSDGVSYYEHVKFFIKSLSSGVYPLWDPFWNGSGVSNEFFLRRFGSFNPVFLILLVLYKAGISFWSAYLLFLTIYYFIGMFGFYKLAHLLFQDKRCAFLAYLLLTFSSLGTRLFDSYILYFSIPIIWFFYFFLSFAKRQEKHSFLGILFSLMLILTTYVPFYFINIVLTFIFCLILFYSKDVIKFLVDAFVFCKKYKILTILCLVILLLSMLPGLMLIKDGNTKDFVLPHRHYTATDTNAMQVGFETITSWGMLEDLVYSAAYSDFTKFKFAIVYIPIFIFILFFLGFFNPINKRILFLLTWGLILFCMHSPYFPFYGFLYEKIFYFKYFRNLHFYLWVALIPIVIIFAVEHFHLFLNRLNRAKRMPLMAALSILLVHILILILLIRQGDAVVSTYLSVFLSGLFLMLICFRDVNFKTFIIGLFLVVLCQPLEVYHYLNVNSQKATLDYGYDKLSDKFSFTRPGEKEVDSNYSMEDRLKFHENRVYYSTGWFSYLDQNIYYPILSKYLIHKFLIYDRVQAIRDQDINFIEFEKSLLNGENKAYIDSSGINEVNGYSGVQKKVIAETTNSDLFKVVGFNANGIKLKTNYDSNKFLVYNDAFHQGWKVFINDKEAKIFRANVAFKGINLPAGENTVEFNFVDVYGRKYWNDLFMGLFYFVFFSLLFSGIKLYRPELE